MVGPAELQDAHSKKLTSPSGPTILITKLLVKCQCSQCVKLGIHQTYLKWFLDILGTSWCSAYILSSVVLHRQAEVIHIRVLHRTSTWECQTLAITTAISTTTLLWLSIMSQDSWKGAMTSHRVILIVHKLAETHMVDHAHMSRKCHLRAHAHTHTATHLLLLYNSCHKGQATSKKGSQSQGADGRQ